MQRLRSTRDWTEGAWSQGCECSPVLNYIPRRLDSLIHATGLLMERRPTNLPLDDRTVNQLFPCRVRRTNSRTSSRISLNLHVSARTRPSTLDVKPGAQISAGPSASGGLAGPPSLTGKPFRAVWGRTLRVASLSLVISRGTQGGCNHTPTGHDAAWSEGVPHLSQTIRFPERGYAMFPRQTGKKLQR